jgi:hypothetical protein
VDVSMFAGGPHLQPSLALLLARKEQESAGTGCFSGSSDLERETGRKSVMEGRREGRRRESDWAGKGERLGNPRRTTSMQHPSAFLSDGTADTSPTRKISSGLPFPFLL